MIRSSIVTSTERGTDQTEQADLPGFGGSKAKKNNWEAFLSLKNVRDSEEDVGHTASQ